MAKYTTTLGFANEPELGNKGLVITVKKENEPPDEKKEILGHLMVGKASLVWFKKNKKTKGHQVSWEELEAWITKQPEGNASRP
jgi:hypothetical protein